MSSRVYKRAKDLLCGGYLRVWCLQITCTVCLLNSRVFTDLSGGGKKKSAFLSVCVYWINIYTVWSHWKLVFMATFPCASGCGFVSQHCNIHSLSGRHLNIFLLSLCWLLIMWMQGLLCFLLRAFAWDYFIIIFESDNRLNIKQRAVRSSACHLSPFQWLSSDFFLFHFFIHLMFYHLKRFFPPFPPSHLACLFAYLWASADSFKEGPWTCQFSLQQGSLEETDAAVLLSIFIFF